MDTRVDVQMPVRAGGFIPVNVIQSLLTQDADFTFYVDATDDFVFPKDHDEMLNLLGASPENEARIRTGIRTAFKRNKMRECGDSPYVYLADPDVLLPERPVLGSMVRGLERHPQLGAVGVRYLNSRHIATGSMMLRRTDFERIGELKGVGDEQTAVRFTIDANGDVVGTNELQKRLLTKALNPKA